MGEKFLFDGPEDAPVTILLAHGAGAPMDSASMNATAKALAAAGFRVARFEFGYMAARRTSEGRKPPPRAETLNPEYVAAVDALGTKGPLVIGGKSMGGRVASMIADDLHASGKIVGLLCLGYPFHPPAKPWVQPVILPPLQLRSCRRTTIPFATHEMDTRFSRRSRCESVALCEGRCPAATEPGRGCWREVAGATSAA